VSGRGHNSLGFGGTFGRGLGGGVAIVLIITVIAIGRALARQLTGAMSVVITFAEVAVCTILGSITLAALGLLAYRAQLARYHLAERRLGLEQQAREVYAVRAEILESDQLESGGRAALEGGEAEGLECAMSKGFTSRNASLPRSAKNRAITRGNRLGLSKLYPVPADDDQGGAS
jgi:hypothetical protein